MQSLMENEQRSSSQSPAATKLCPFCAERIQLLAIKCRYCGEFLDRPPAAKPSSKWYYSNLTMIGSLLTLGPLALPLVWANPRFKVWVKAVITAATIAFTLLLCWAMVGMYVHLMDQIQSLGLMK